MGEAIGKLFGIKRQKRDTALDEAIAAQRQSQEDERVRLKQEEDALASRPRVGALRFFDRGLKQKLGG